MRANGRPRIGLALSGGAVHGLAHIGVLTVLEGAGIPVDYVAGISGGGRTADHLERGELADHAGLRRQLAGLEHGAPPIAPELAARIRGELGQAAAQSELLRLVAQGLTYREVARQLHLSEPAVKYHMKQILEHLHLANRAQAEAYARRSGLGGTRG